MFVTGKDDAPRSYLQKILVTNVSPRNERYFRALELRSEMTAKTIAHHYM